MRFRIRAVTAANVIEDIELEAADEAAARRLAEAQGLGVLSATLLLSGAVRGGRFPLLLLNQELLALLTAGIPLAESLSALAEKEMRPAIRQVLAVLIAALREGRPLSAALAARPDCFPELYVATMRAAERTSDLAPALGRYIAYQRQIEFVRDRLVAAALYPLLLLVVGAAVMLFLLVYVVPRFARVFETVGGDLPWLSRLLLDWGRLVEGRGDVLAVLACGGVAGLLALLRRQDIWAALLGLAWRLPRIGGQLRVFELARLYRTLGMLLRGGIPAVAAMGMVEGLLSPRLRAGLGAAAADIRNGERFSAALQRHALATPVALRMLAVGERAGKLGEMLERAAEFHEEESARQLEVVTRLAGPLLMLIVAMAVGLVLVMLYLPIFQVAESIQ